MPQSPVFAAADSAPRRDRTTLYVVAFRIADARRRRRVQRILQSFGEQVAPGAFEVPTSPAGMRTLERALAPELQPADNLRVYPVCARCRAEARMWGEGQLAGLSSALIY